MPSTDPILASEVDTVGEDACTGVAAVIFEADVSEIATVAAAGKGNKGVRSLSMHKNVDEIVTRSHWGSSSFVSKPWLWFTDGDDRRC